MAKETKADRAFMKRCQELADRLQRDGILRQGSPAQTIAEFVIAERGRQGSPKLADCAAVVLYLSDADAAALVAELQPRFVARKVP